MVKIYFFGIVFLLILSTFVSSTDTELQIPAFGDDQLYAVVSYGDDQLFSVYSYFDYTASISVPVTDNGTVPGNSVGRYTMVSTPSYGIIVELLDTTYEIPYSIKSALNIRYSFFINKVKAKITVINKRTSSDKNAVLKYYVEDPFGNKIGLQEEVFKEIKKSCVEGLFVHETGLCELRNGEVYPPINYIIMREIILPHDAMPGDWKFIVTYETPVQDLIKVDSGFSVRDSFIMVVLLVSILVVVIYKKYKIRMKIVKRDND